MLMFRKLPLFALALSVIQLSGCLPKEDPRPLHEKLRSSFWYWESSCGDDSGGLTFDYEDTGTISQTLDCETGFDCYTYLSFEWSVDESSGILTVNYFPYAFVGDFDICSQEVLVGPPSESVLITESTSSITLLGKTYDY